ncbi:hypothetical protein Smlt1921 [Stenotrophomonas maltophilia K279a]|uniref:Uncharacterized protein n=2 Tax=Stenotrophomonas maltophilia TaxID=40324 RepID=B2FM72_STRMK|nr:hypothetical protein Smlt1921 [Stenotrophomonas maltophilia K279a]
MRWWRPTRTTTRRAIGGSTRQAITNRSKRRARPGGDARLPSPASKAVPHEGGRDHRRGHRGPVPAGAGHWRHGRLPAGRGGRVWIPGGAVMTIVNMTVDAEIDLDDLVENLGPNSKEYLTNLLKVDGEAARAPDGRTFEQIIEAAFYETRAMPSVPRALVELFWVVHGRAMS